MPTIYVVTCRNEKGYCPPYVAAAEVVEQPTRYKLTQQHWAAGYGSPGYEVAAFYGWRSFVKKEQADLTPEAAIRRFLESRRESVRYAEIRVKSAINDLDSARKALADAEHIFPQPKI